MKSRRRPAYKRKKLTRKDCNEIYNEYLDNGIKAGKNLCSQKGYQTTTFYKCLRSEGEINPKWRHPSHCNKWSDDLIDKACMLISNNPILTLEEIIQTMTKNYNAPEIEPTTLSNYLTFSLITLKNVAFHAIARNSEQTKDQRVKYGEFFVQNNELNYIFIDEVGFSICVQRNRGRAPKGVTPIVKLPLSKTPNCSCCMAISNDEILFYKKKNSAYDGESFALFLRDLIEIIQSKGMQNVILVMDNSPVHQEKLIKRECEGRVRYMFLPPYSPNLNPIENIFGIIKKFMKKILATQLKDELLATFHLEWGQKTAAREAILDEAFTIATSQISSEILNDTYEHMKKYVTLALERKDI